jgi:hypothetical protein
MGIRSNVPGRRNGNCGNCFDRMGRMGRMKKMIASALGSLPQRPERIEGNGSRLEWRPERPFPSILSGRLGGEPGAEAIIFYILSILHIPSKQFPQLP